jgi:hypothetical protein
MLNAETHVLEARPARAFLVTSTKTLTPRAIQVVIACTDQPVRKAIDIVADVPSIGQTHRIIDHQGNMDERNQGHYQVGFAPARRTDDDVGLLIRTLCDSASAMMDSGAVRFRYQRDV